MTLKEKIKSGKKLNGMHVSLCDPCIGDLVGNVGFDYIWVDLEHSYMNIKDAYTHIASIQAAGCAVIVRVPQDDLTYTKKILEIGPDGIIFPMVTAKDASRLISYTLYPPEGIRGFGPMRAIRYGARDTYEFVRQNAPELCRFIQIELKQTVDELQEIVKNPYIDAYIFGPCDLSGSIGELPNFTGENTVTQIKRAMEILNANGKAAGLSMGPTDTKIIKMWHDLGIQMISAGADYEFVRAKAFETLANLRESHSEI